MPSRRTNAPPEPRRVALTEARAHLGELVNSVHVKKEPIVLERGGLPLAVLISYDEAVAYLGGRNR